VYLKTQNDLPISTRRVWILWRCLVCFIAPCSLRVSAYELLCCACIVSSIKLEKLVGRGEALLLQTHSTHTRMIEGGFLSFLFFFLPLSFLNRHTLQDCNSFLGDHVIAQVSKVWLILLSNYAGKFLLLL